MVLNYLVFKEDLFAVNEGPNPGPRQPPPPTAQPAAAALCHSSDLDPISSANVRLELAGGQPCFGDLETSPATPSPLVPLLPPFRPSLLLLLWCTM
jgi:hypothetical protein